MITKIFSCLRLCPCLAPRNTRMLRGPQTPLLQERFGRDPSWDQRLVGRHMSNWKLVALRMKLLKCCCLGQPSDCLSVQRLAVVPECCARLETRQRRLCLRSRKRLDFLETPSCLPLFWRLVSKCFMLALSLADCVLPCRPSLAFL